MAAKDIEAGRAHVLVSIRDKFSQGLKGVERNLSSLGKRVATIGAGVFAGAAGMGAVVGGALASFVGFGSSLNDMSGRTGASAEALSEYAYAAEMTGASMEDLEKALRNMAKNGKSADQFDAIAAKIAAIQDPTKQAQAAMKVWGKSGAALLPMARDLGALRGEAKKLGVSLSNDSAAAADDLGDSWDRLKKSGMGIVYQLVGQLAPSLIELSEVALGIITNVRAWVNANSALVVPLAKIGLLVAALGAGLVVAGGFLIAIGMAAGFVASALSVIFSPIGLIIGAIIGLGVAAYLFRDQIASAIASVVSFFRPAIAVVMEIGAIFQQTFGGIVAELMSGNLSNAASIAWLGIQAAAWAGVAGIGAAATWALDALQAWIPGVDSIREYLGQAFGGIGSAILNGRWDIAGALVMAKLYMAIVSAWASINSVWSTTIFALGVAWDSMAYGMSTIFRTVVNSIAKSLVWLAEKLHIVPKGIREELNKMQQESQKRDDTALNKKLSARNDSKLKADNATAAAVKAQQDKIAGLEAEAAKAGEEGGITTIDQKAVESKGNLDAALKAAEEAREKARLAGEQAAKPAEQFGNKAVTLGTEKSKIAGSFSAAGALAIGGGKGDAVNQTAKNTKRLVELNEQLLKKKGPAFT